VSTPSQDQNSPLPPAPPLGRPGPVSRPKAIDTAFQLAVAGILVGLIGEALVVSLDRDQLVHFIREMLTSAGTPFTEDDVVGFIATFRVALFLGTAVFIGLLVLFAFKMRAGRNWARVLLTAFTLLRMVNFLAAVTASGAELKLIWSLAGVAFSVAAVIYMFRPESSKFFVESKQRR
jgi:hypothetical protein